MLLTRPGISETRPPETRTGRWLEISSSPPSLAYCPDFTPSCPLLPPPSSSSALLRHRSQRKQNKSWEEIAVHARPEIWFWSCELRHNVATWEYIISYSFETRRKFEEDEKLVRAGRAETDRQSLWLDLWILGLLLLLLLTCFVVMQSDCTSVGRICQRVSVHKTSYLPLETCLILIPIKLTTKSSSSWASALFLFFFSCVKRHLSCMHCS